MQFKESNGKASGTIAVHLLISKGDEMGFPHSSWHGWGRGKQGQVEGTGRRERVDEARRGLTQGKRPDTEGVKIWRHPAAAEWLNAADGGRWQAERGQG